jgi:SAM-dependent methyltransferase
MFDLNLSESIEKQNKTAYDRMARSGHVLATVASPDELSKPLETIDTSRWLGNSIRGWHVLCLAAAGGRHSALYQAAGAIVTVVDISEGMLELDRQVAQELRFNVRLIQASMVHMPMLHDQEFDLVIQPVSTCYVENIAPVFAEVARVLKPQGLYISQHKQPINLQASLATRNGTYTLETETGQPALCVPSDAPSPLREPNTREFAHSLDAILGGICRSGFLIEDVVEPLHANLKSAVDSIGHRSRFIPPYIRIKARKQGLAGLPGRSLVLPT